MLKKFLPRIILVLCLVTHVGCTSGFDRLARRGESICTAKPYSYQQIERGHKRPVIDGVGWIVGIPEKVILWDRRIDNHEISPRTENAISQYVDDLGLPDTKVRLNQYAPVDEWRRLTSNDQVGWGWRYTLGVWSWLDEAVFPRRIFGGDHYNPYTNTISIFSDSPAIAVKEGSRARDVRSRRYPGTYAAVNSLPLVSMWYDTVATGYAMDYLHNDLPDSEQEGYHLLYPAYGAHLGSEIASLTPIPNTIGAVVGAIPGHLVGRYRGRQYVVGETARAQSTEANAFHHGE